eukprot:3626006-Prymnesium_polylepis.1
MRSPDVARISAPEKSAPTSAYGVALRPVRSARHLSDCATRLSVPAHVVWSQAAPALHADLASSHHRLPPHRRTPPAPAGAHPRGAPAPTGALIGWCGSRAGAHTRAAGTPRPQSPTSMIISCSPSSSSSALGPRISEPRRGSTFSGDMGRGPPGASAVGRTSAARETPSRTATARTSQNGAALRRRRKRPGARCRRSGGQATRADPCSGSRHDSESVAAAAWAWEGLVVDGTARTEGAQQPCLRELFWWDRFLFGALGACSLIVARCRTATVRVTLRTAEGSDRAGRGGQWRGARRAPN